MDLGELSRAIELRELARRRGRALRRRAEPALACEPSDAGSSTGSDAGTRRRRLADDFIARVGGRRAATTWRRTAASSGAGFASRAAKPRRSDRGRGPCARVRPRGQGPPGALSDRSRSGRVRILAAGRAARRRSGGELLGARPRAGLDPARVPVDRRSGGDRLVALGRGAELPGRDRRVRKPDPWLTGRQAIAPARRDAAAETLAAIGAKPDEALARLRAAADLLSGKAGRMTATRSSSRARLLPLGSERRPPCREAERVSARAAA